MKETTTEMFLQYRAHIADMNRRLRCPADKPYTVEYEEWLHASIDLKMVEINA